MMDAAAFWPFKRTCLTPARAYGNIDVVPRLSNAQADSLISWLAGSSYERISPSESADPSPGEWRQGDVHIRLKRAGSDFRVSVSHGDAWG
jgi:hypothetical protein